MLGNGGRCAIWAGTRAAVGWCVACWDSLQQDSLTHVCIGEYIMNRHVLMIHVLICVVIHVLIRLLIRVLICVLICVLIHVLMIRVLI